MSYENGELLHGRVLTGKEWELARVKWNHNPAGEPPDRMIRDGYGGILAGGYVFWLPHRCDEWDIGGVEDAKRLIADLQAAIAEAE